MTPEEVAKNMSCKLEFVQDNWPPDKPKEKPKLVPTTAEVVPIVPSKPAKKKKKSKKK